LICAQEAHWQLELDSVLLMPVGEAPHKQVDEDPGREARFELCRLAAESDGWLSASRREVDRDGPSYTVDTLRHMRDEAPEDELFFVMGGDAATGLGGWREPQELLRLATVAVAERESARRDQVTAAIADLAGGDGVRFFSMPTIEVSSTLVRERVGRGRPIRHLVPDAVADEIERAGLYSGEGDA
jgi:nicotinate-nucleotide adenylyltransferase